jgi:hypothetical protein
MSNFKERMDVFFDKHAPSIVISVKEYRTGYIEIRKRGGRIRAFTEITKDNAMYCEELLNLVDELRHMHCQLVNWYKFDPAPKLRLSSSVKIYK